MGRHHVRRPCRRSGTGQVAAGAAPSRWSVGLVLVAAGAVSGALLTGWAGMAAGATGGGAPLAFIPAAEAVVVSAAPLRAAPGSGGVVGRIRPGEEIDVGGRVRYRAGLTEARAYWIRSHGTVGFVPEGAVAVTGAPPPDIDWRGLSGRDFARLRVVAAPAAPGAGDDDGFTGDLGFTGNATVAIPWLPEAVDAWRPVIDAAAARHGVSPDLVAIIVLLESGGNPSARSPSGAVGLMQVMPATARDVAARRGWDTFTEAALGDPGPNVDIGTWYLADQLRSFAGHGLDEAARVGLGAAAYNGGPGHLLAHLDGAPLAAEARDYRQWVVGMWRERDQASSPTYRRWLAAGGWRLVAAASVSQVAMRPPPGAGALSP